MTIDICQRKLARPNAPLAVPENILNVLNGHEKKFKIEVSAGSSQMYFALSGVFYPLISDWLINSLVMSLLSDNTFSN